MKIGLVCPYNVTLGGGVQEVVFGLQQHLTARGHTAKIIAAQPRQEPPIDRGHIVYIGNAVDMRWPNHTSAPLSSEINTEVIDQILAAEDFDILHFHEPWVPVVSRQILARSHAINIATFHASVPETLLSRTFATAVTPYFRSMLRDLDVLTAVSAPAAAFVGSMTDRDIVQIPNGIELTQFHPSSLTAGQQPIKTILYIGRLEQRKGVRYLLHAFAELARSDSALQLVIAGEGPQRRALETIVSNLAIPRVSFLGYISEERKAVLLAEAAVFCSPALYGESFGIVLLEAMASGLPAVAGNNPGYAALMQGVGGLSLINPRDTPEFARRLRLMIDEPAIRAAWKTWAADYVQQFTYPRIIDQYEALYRQALTRSVTYSLAAAGS